MKATDRLALAALTAIGIGATLPEAKAQGLGETGSIGSVGTPTNPNPRAPEVIPNTGLDSAARNSISPNTGSTGFTGVSPNTGSSFGSGPMPGQPRSVPFPESQSSNRTSSFYNRSDASPAGLSANTPATPAQAAPIQNPGYSGMNTSRSAPIQRSTVQGTGFVAGLGSGLSGPQFGVLAGIPRPAPGQELVIRNRTAPASTTPASPAPAGKITIHQAPSRSRINIIMSPQPAPGAVSVTTDYPRVSEVAGSTGLIAGFTALTSVNTAVNENLIVNYDVVDTDDEDVSGSNPVYWVLITMLLVVGGALAAFVGLNWRGLNRPNHNNRF